MKFFRNLVLLFLVLIAAVVINRLTVPNHNTDLTHFDTLIVLGTPANPDGTASGSEQIRVIEAIHEYQAGIAPQIIMSGGAAHNQFVEAHAMATFAISQGIPKSAIIEEGESLNTIQNIFYSSQIMKSRNWHSAEVISSSAHLGRAALILQAMAKAHPPLAIDWRTHPAPWPPGYRKYRRFISIVIEASRCLELRIFGFPRSRFLP